MTATTVQGDQAHRDQVQADQVNVDLGDRSYDVAIGRGLIGDAGTRITALFGRRRAAIVTDETVAGLHLARLQAALAASGIEAEALILPAGEATKRWDKLGETVEWLISQKIERKDLVIAFGGGVIGDLAGFAAAILRRGVRFVQIPTTLLAQVDSSVGGKTGINSPQGKNLIGAFHQPSLVLADIDVLDTLTPRDFRAGYGEVAKYGLLGDERFFEWLEANATELAADPVRRAEAVRHSVAMKAGIVQRDETEQGERALLNLGHTFGHALEAATGYSDRLLHGEGVAIGCVLAFDLSARQGLCAQEAPSRVAAHFAKMGLPTRIADIAGALPDDEGLIALMAQDKKVEAGKLRFILAHGIGQAFVTDAVDPSQLRAVLAQSRA
ncbi:3-dehydroquinate synthase [Paracoccus aminophilus]|uniref:3-dehydroquinate synthase n=1 Tax=Paracoccus aminophilus JCM 7686 TaxID=1367847 RepID=S5YTW7_PARAH|nr:3-dehydroquinate synthase [Paracoccus aminophilus]AGT08666.1 3-dehydroquinate synthase [Paracoccus aminophilus JCM 7686]